jgi:putative transposase
MRIYEDDRDYRYFLALMGNVLHDFNVECWNYCLMPNHYHLTVRPREPNLSIVMQRLNGIYAQWWNRQHDHVGHVFQGRYKAQIVGSDEYLRCLCGYVARNPRRAELVARPEDWPWSSYAAIVGLKPAPAFLNVAATLQQFGPGNDTTLLQARFRDFVFGDPDEAIEDRLRSTEQIIGDNTFKASLKSSILITDPGPLHQSRAEQLQA